MALPRCLSSLSISLCIYMYRQILLPCAIGDPPNGLQENSCPCVILGTYLHICFWFCKCYTTRPWLVSFPRSFYIVTLCTVAPGHSSVCLGVRLPGGKIRVHVEPLLFPGCGSCQSRRWVVGAWRESVLGPLGPGRALLRRHRPRRRQLRPLGSTSRYERALRALCSSAAGFC